MRATTSSSLAWRALAPRRALLRGALAGAFALSAAACSSSPSSTATTASGATTSSAAAGGGRNGNAAEMNALSSQIQAGEQRTFKAVYNVQTAAGKSQTITVEQKPPKSVLATDSGSVINDGTKTYFCSSTGAASCLAVSGSNPLASLTAIFDPQTILSTVQRAAAQADAHAAGYSLSFSSASYGGQSAKCVTYAGAGQTGKACATTTGVLAYVQAAGNTVTLTSLSSSPPDSDFSLPAGASVVTEPSVP